MDKKNLKLVCNLNLICGIALTVLYFILYFTGVWNLEHLITSAVITIPYITFSIIIINQVKSDSLKKEKKSLVTGSDKTENQTVESYKTFIAARNYYFSKHIENVAAYSKIILDELEKLPEYKNTINEEYKCSVLNGAILHDIGKLDLPDEMINRFYEYYDSEIDIIKEIPEKGYKIFQTFKPGSFSKNEKSIIENIIIQHQELLNGTGYPKHLFNRQISLEAQIVSVADYIDSNLMYIEGQKNKEFNSVYMELITKGYEAYNQTIVNLLYERRAEIIEYADKCNSEIKNHIEKL